MALSDMGDIVAAAEYTEDFENNDAKTNIKN